MVDAMGVIIHVGDSVVTSSTTSSAARIVFARVKSIGPKRVTLERIEGHPKTLPTWQERSTREHSEVLVVQL